MKNTFIVVLFLLVAGCTDVRQKLLPVFEVSIPAISLKVPPIPFVAAEEIPLGAMEVRVNLDSAIRANTAGVFGADAVHNVSVKRITIATAHSNAKTNLSNFETARIKIFSDTAEHELAFITFPDSAVDSISIQPGDPMDISMFLKQPTLSYNLYWKNRKPIEKPINIKVTITLNVQ